MQQHYHDLYAQNKELEAQVALIERDASDTMELYTITKEISKYLDEDKLFMVFREEIERHIDFQDCRFVRQTANLKDVLGYEVIPFILQKGSPAAGYLLIKGLSEKDREKFDILTHQFMLVLKRAFLYLKVQELSIVDSLTGIFNRRYYLERFAQELERSLRFGLTFAILMIDVDHFKNCNDRYGHLVGDQILRHICNSIKENSRQVDLLGRFGGEEFILLLPQTKMEEAIFVAERIRQAIEQGMVKAYDETLKATISIGLSFFPDHGRTQEELIDKADQALYKAKQSGRNRIYVCQG
jgi:diguanylate cyclase (GGDEF)-like protein